MTHDETQRMMRLPQLPTRSGVLTLLLLLLLVLSAEYNPISRVHTTRRT
jgi:hypothetical protein